MSIAATKQKSLMKRRKMAILLSAAVVLILSIALVLVLDYARTQTFEDVDGSSYYIRKRNGAYAMYDADRQLLPLDEEYDCYVTAAGTMIEVDAETGKWSVYAVVDTEGYEEVGVNSRILLFPRVRKDDILSLEVHNSHGSYTFIRYNEKNEPGPDASFVIKESPLTSFSPEKFTTLHVSAGYTISLEKLVDPIRDENGEYTEYGLAPETRTKSTDEEGNELEEPIEYAYEPAYYILTQTNGTQHKVILGDKLVTGGGYYAQYVEIKDGQERKLPGVYVLDTDTGTYLSYAVEEYVTPMLTCGLSLSNYYDVENFSISNRLEGARPSDETLYETLLSFTFVDLADREGTIQEAHPYQFQLNLNGFTPSSSSIEPCLNAMYSPTFAQKAVRILAPTNEDLARYGLFEAVRDENGNILTDENGEEQYVPFAPYRILFDYDVLNETNSYAYTVSHSIVISRPSDETLNPNGNYFAYSAFREYIKNEDGTQTPIMEYTSNMIVELESYAMDFLSWDMGDWVNTTYINGNIAYVSKIELSAPSTGYSATFDLDNSMSAPNSDGTTGSTYLTVDGSDSEGNSRKTFNYQQYVDVNGYLWIVSTADLRVCDAVTLESKTMADGIPYYGYNKLGRQVLCRNGYIDCKDYDVEVTADKVRIYSNDHSTLLQEMDRFDTDLFRNYYEVLLYATIVDAYEPESEEELQKILSNEILTLTITTTDSEGTYTNTYTFYQISSRKAYITINGNGGFYVYKNRVDKFISDAYRFFDGELINPTGKN